jgi:uncharacterized Tic20 family protein
MSDDVPAKPIEEWPDEFDDGPEEDPITSQDRQMALLAHVTGFFCSFVMPLVLWLQYRDKQLFVAQHCRESLNYQISLYVHAFFLNLPYAAVFLVLWKLYDLPMFQALMIASVVVIVLAILLVILETILIVRASLAAHRGRPFRYPLTLRLI